MLRKRPLQARVFLRGFIRLDDIIRQLLCHETMQAVHEAMHAGKKYNYMFLQVGHSYSVDTYCTLNLNVSLKARR